MLPQSRVHVNSIQVGQDVSVLWDEVSCESRVPEEEEREERRYMYDDCRVERPMSEKMREKMCEKGC